jgi:hypothetical protein
MKHLRTRPNGKVFNGIYRPFPASDLFICFLRSLTKGGDPHHFGWIGSQLLPLITSAKYVRTLVGVIILLCSLFVGKANKELASLDSSSR